MAEPSPTFSPAFTGNTPASAEYYKLVGQINHGYEVTTGGNLSAGTGNRQGAVLPGGAFEGQIGAQEQRAKANTAYNEAQLAKGVQGQYAANERRANKGGLLESGINAANRGKIGSQYEANRFRGIKNLQERIAGYGEQRQNAKTTGEGQLSDAQWKALIAAEKETPNTVPGEYTAAGGGPPGSSVTAGPGSPQQPIKAGFKEAEKRPLQFGFKDVEAKERKEAQRRAAAKKAKRR